MQNLRAGFGGGTMLRSAHGTHGDDTAALPNIVESLKRSRDVDFRISEWSKVGRQDEDDQGENKEAENSSTRNEGAKKRGMITSFRAPSPFIQKLFSLLQDEANAAAVGWTPAGTSFVIRNTSLFCEEVLPRYFRHNNLSSFVRQLNQYGFHKRNPSRWEFQHDKFARHKPKLLKSIDRKASRAAGSSNEAENSTIVSDRSMEPNAALSSPNYRDEEREADTRDYGRLDETSMVAVQSSLNRMRRDIEENHVETQSAIASLRKEISTISKDIKFVVSCLRGER